jgi:hypothetical protein
MAGQWNQPRFVQPGGQWARVRIRALAAIAKHPMHQTPALDSFAGPSSM